LETEMMEFPKNRNPQGSRILKCYGLPEKRIADLLQPLFKATSDMEWGIYPNHPEYHILLNLPQGHDPLATQALDAMEKRIRHLIGPYIVAVNDENMEDTVAEMLNNRGLTLAVAESCTGGRIGNRLTNVPGSSGFFLGGVIAYSNKAKHDLLNVSSKTLNQYGAVSEQTAREMAEGVRKRFQSYLALAVTGIAGPDGGTDDKPVGTVHIGLSVINKTFSGKYRFTGMREQIKQESSEMALDWIRRYLNDDPFLPGV
jgi:nicotinamide-nucleotide amidase